MLVEPYGSKRCLGINDGESTMLVDPYGSKRWLGPTIVKPKVMDPNGSKSKLKIKGSENIK